ncbi:hypothetical protein ACTFIR_001825 [Dictyostelium discoideum]
MFKITMAKSTGNTAISSALNSLKQNYTPSNIVSLYSKTALELKDAKEFYGKSYYPGQLVPNFYQTKYEAEQDDTDNSSSDIVIDEKFKIVLQTQQHQQEIEDTNVFNINQYFQGLKSILFGNQIIHSKLLSSTQSLSLKYLSNTKQGIVVVSDQQTNGKGRGGNQWVSPMGCLLYSFKCKQTDGTKLPFLQYVAGLALIEAIHSFPIASDLNVRLKWPNDIYDGDSNLKIGGILCQSNYFDNQFDITIGIGLNVTNSSNPTISINEMIFKKENKKTTTTTTTTPTPTPPTTTPIYISRESLLSRFFNVFEEIYLTFTRDGFRTLEKRYTDAWLHSGSVVQIKEKNNQYVKIIGITENAFLKSIECDSNGNQTSNIIHELHPDGTSFDIENLILKEKK